MECTPANVSDISRYFKNTYVKLAEFGEKIFLLNEVTASYIQLTDSNGDLFRILIRREYPYNLEYVLPHKAIFAYKKSVYMLERIPARQYQRGCSSANTTIKEVFSGKQVGMDFRSLEAFTNKPTYVSIKDALFEEFPKTVIGLPITKRFSFFRPGQDIYIDRFPIAHFQRDKMLIEVWRKPFVEDLERLCIGTDVGVKYVAV